MREVELLCDKVLIMGRGCLIEQGAPEKLRQFYGKDSLEEVFLYLNQHGGGK